MTSIERPIEVVELMEVTGILPFQSGPYLYGRKFILVALHIPSPKGHSRNGCCHFIKVGLCFVGLTIMKLNLKGQCNP